MVEDKAPELSTANIPDLHIELVKTRLDHYLKNSHLVMDFRKAIEKIERRLDCVRLNLAPSL